LIDNFENFKEMWDSEPIIVLDTNVVLRLYSFTPEAISQALETLKSTINRVWLPAQVLNEFNDNHVKERNRNFNKYKDFLKPIRSAIEKSKNSLEGHFTTHLDLKYPHIDEFKGQISELINQMQKVTEKYEKNIKDDIEINRSALNEDDPKKFIDELIELGSIGERYTLSEMISIYQEGETRFKHLIPPGYEDVEKDEKDETKLKKYGDLVLWKQTHKKASIESKDLIFVTNDLKGDWWTLVDGKPIGARDELTIEFSDVVGKDFIMTTGANFINYVSKINHIDSKQAYLEMNISEVCKQLFEEQDWSLILEEKRSLTFYLIHSGDLQPFIGDPISDVEIIDYPAASDVEFEVKAVDYHLEKAFIHGSFTTKVEISVTTSGGYQTTDGYCEIEGSFSVEFELNTDDDEEIFKEGTDKFVVGGFGITNFDEFHQPTDFCIYCSSSTNYFTASGDGICEKHKDKFDYCPDCDTLYSKGSLNGGKCKNCGTDV